jgi:hypothetical protein
MCRRLHPLPPIHLPWILATRLRVSSSQVVVSKPPRDHGMCHSVHPLSPRRVPWIWPIYDSLDCLKEGMWMSILCCLWDV